MTYNIEFRRNVLEVKKRENLSIRQIAKHFKINAITIKSWMRCIESRRTRNKPASKINMNELRKDMNKYLDAYLYEHAERFNVSISGINQTLRLYAKKKASSILNLRNHSAKSSRLTLDFINQ